MKKMIPSFDYWLLDPNLQDILLTAEQTAEWNKVNFKHDPVFCDLVSLSPAKDRSDIRTAIEECDTSKILNYYDTGGKLFTEQFVSNMQKLINIPQPGTSGARKYGLAIERCNLRSFPTNVIAMNDDLDPEVDRFQESAIYPLEPVVILHTSSDSKWYFIQTYNYRGWVQVSSVDSLGYNDFVQCIKDFGFWYVTQDFVTLQLKTAVSTYREIQMPMGSRIPRFLLENKLSWMVIRCDLNQKWLRTKPLECSLANITYLAMMCVGQQYDWGGKKGYRDCSSFITDIFRCHGIQLARNANQQANSLSSVEFHVKTNEDLNNLKPGCLIFITGHVMLYLGKHDDEHYVVHAVKEFYTMENGVLEKSRLTGVQITPLDIFMKNGDSYISNIYAVCEIKPIA